VVGNDDARQTKQPIAKYRLTEAGRQWLEAQEERK